ncbi:MAG: protein-disulfide reductase DsbD family protein [Paracoccaceae bacterium]
MRLAPCFPLSRSLSLALAAALALAPLTAGARGTDQDDVLAGDLLPGWQTDSGAHIAGVRLQLAQGWKTYWRAPGDAGIPPRFDWSGSENLKSVRIVWPAPTVFHTSGFKTIGYKGGVVLPVEVVAQDPARPVRLRASVELGVCRDICLPAWLELAVDMPPPGAPDAAIKAALQAVPRTAREAGVGKVSCTVEPIADGLRVTASIALPRQKGDETVAVETGDPRVWVGEATAERRGGTLVAVAEMVGPSGQPFALDRSALVMTVISDRGAVEIRGCPAP